jgi:hypothetical protein
MAMIEAQEELEAATKKAASTPDVDEGSHALWY